MPRHPGESQRAPALRVGGDLLPCRGERAGGRRVRRAVALRAGERSADGAADHDRRHEARVGQADQCRDPVLRLLPPGPQGAVPRADQREARRRSPVHRGRRPGDLGRPALGADPGLLRLPVRPPHRAPDPVRLLQGRAGAARRQPGRGGARRRADQDLGEAPRVPPRGPRVPLQAPLPQGGPQDRGDGGRR